MKRTGKIIPLAFPDLFVKLSDERRASLLRLVGIGTKTHIKAGHASMVLVDGTTGELHYFDYGRYVTPEGKGRVRGKITDVDVTLPMTAKFDDDGVITNIEDILTWLQTNPQKTHGGGRMIASVGDIDFDAAYAYASKLLNMGSIPYKAFGSNSVGVSTNCSRFVTDTLLEGITDKKIKKKLKFNKCFTPSPIGNVEIAANGSTFYMVSKGVVKTYTSSAFKENLVNFFDKKIPQSKTPEVEAPLNAQYLPGIGCGAYFKIEETENSNIFRIKRYNDYAEEDFSGLFQAEKDGFETSENFQFTYDSHCLYCHINQGGTTYKFNVIN